MPKMQQLALGLTALFISGAAEPTCITNTSVPTSVPYSVIPSHYSLALQLLDPQTAPKTFSGAVNISATVNVATTCIVLNAKGLKLLAAHVGDIEASITQHPETEMAIFNFQQTFGASGSEDINIHITYNGSINHESANGLFLSENTVPDPVPGEIKRAMALWREHKYQRRGRRVVEQHGHAGVTLKGADAGTEMMFATQFEETDARAVFPAFDEPSLKATFEATVTVPHNSGNTKGAPLQVLFNTRNSSAAECSAGSCTHTFERTLNPLPTYLVALAVGHFDFLEKTGRDGVVIRIVTPPGYAAWAQHALDCSVHAVEFFSTSYGLPYGEMNHKMDSISVTAIDMDAMENQGLLTYAPTMLLLDPDHKHWLQPMDSFLEQKQLICLVTTHEISHQWFGDTVTMRDWQQEYLNEGFARFLQALGTDDLFPEWDTVGFTGNGTSGPNGFFQFSFEVAMQLDISGTAPAIFYPLDAQATPAQLSQADRSAFHSIFYEKGACVNRMLWLFMNTSEAHARTNGSNGWNSALDTHLHGAGNIWANPTPLDLMHSMADEFKAASAARGANSSSGGGDVLQSVYPWLYRTGYPVVTLSATAATATATAAATAEVTTSGTVTATQQPMSKYQLLENGQVAKWWVPLIVDVSTGGAVAEGAHRIEFELHPHQDKAVHTYSYTAARAITDSAAIVGSPTFNGPFVVRYADTSNWQHVGVTLSKEFSSKPDYVRAQIFHAFLLCRASHDTVDILYKLVIDGGLSAAMATTLSNGHTAAAMTATATLYELIFTQWTKLVVPLGRETSSPLATFARKLLVPLLKATDITMSGRPVEAGVGSSIPIPHSAALAQLRSDSLFWSVYFGDTATTETMLAVFHGGRANSSNMAAAYWAAATSSDDSYQTLQKLYNSTNVSTGSGAGDDGGDAKKAAMLTALTAGAGKRRCDTALALASSVGETKHEMSVLTGMLTHSAACRDTAWTRFVVLARANMSPDAGAFASGRSGFSGLLTTQSQLSSATQLLATAVKRGYVLEGDATTDTTLIKMNIDVAAKHKHRR